MRKLWLIVKREYVIRVRTKAFVLSTLALPLLSIGLLIFSVAMARRQTDQTLKIAILDNVGNLAAPIAQSLSRRLQSGQPAFLVVRTLDRPPSEQHARRELRAQVREAQLDGYLVIPKDAPEGRAAEFHSKNPGNLRFTGSIRRAVTEAVIGQRLSNQGIHLSNLSNIIRTVDVTLVKVTEEGDAVEKGQTWFLALAMAMILYFALLTYGMATMRSVLEEKSTRVIEILIASVRPSQLLAGKILGVAAVGLTQFLIWTITGGLFAAYGTAIVASFRPQARPLELHLPLSTLAYLVVFFLGGYFLYASLYAAIGAMVSTEEDAQQMQWPVTLLVVVAFLLFLAILRNPDSTLSVVLSMIPFFSPIVMLFRIALQTPPWWQIALALMLLVLTTLGHIYISAKIYRVGVLMYGKRPSLMEVLRWLRYT